MAFDIAFNLSGEAREAGKFYSEVFQTPVNGLMTYGEIPDGEVMELDNEARDLVMYSDIQVQGRTIMLWDAILEAGIVKGNNISLSLSFDSEEELRRVYTLLGRDGTVENELISTFFAPLYGEITDKFGVQWMLTLEGKTE
ncbi:VOC family protein [Guggenheimella bovis]